MSYQYKTMYLTAKAEGQLATLPTYGGLNGLLEKKSKINPQYLSCCAEI